ncbi:hypothetical protein ACJZ2D_005798 [Fusarium nematophilum]
MGILSQAPGDGEGDAAFLSITLGRDNAPYRWERRDCSGRLPAGESVRLNPGYTLRSAKEDCIIKYDQAEMQRVTDFNRAYGRAAAGTGASSSSNGARRAGCRRSMSKIVLPAF